MQPGASISGKFVCASGLVARDQLSVCAWPAFAPSFGAAFFAERKMVGVPGFEPGTLRLSSACSNQLSYTPNRSSERVSVEAPERGDFHAFHALRLDAFTGIGGAEETRTPDL